MVVVEITLSSPSDPWSHPDQSFSSSPPSSYGVNCQIDQIILVLEELKKISKNSKNELKKISK